MWIIQWLVDRYAKLVNYLNDWYAAGKAILYTYLGNTLYLIIAGYTLIKDWVDNWRVKSKRLATDWYGLIAWYVGSAFGALQDFKDNWLAGAKVIATTWKGGIDWYVNNAKDALKDFKDNWLAGAKLLATTWRSGLDWYVNTARGALQDFRDNWLAGAKLIATGWRSTLDWYVNTARGALQDFIDNWRAGARKLATDWYSAILLLVTTWFSGISTLVNDWFGGLSWLVNVALPFLLELINDLYDTLKILAKSYSGPISSFFADPTALIVGILEAIAWGFGEWLLAFLLGGVNFTPPDRPPDFGSGTPPGAPPPGPGPGYGEMRYPCSSRSVSGYRFNPPSHYGVDLGISDGAPIWSCRGGTVTFARWDTSGYGYRIDVSHDGGWWSRYGHLKVIYVHEGQTVGQGQTMALGDSTGNSSGPHLHLEIKRNGTYIDPLTVLA